MVALDTLFNYCKKSIDLTKDDNKLYQKMWLMIHALVLQERPILPIHKTVRDKLAIAVSELDRQD